MDDIMLCPACGKELPKESSFCPYCMTKFTLEKQIDNEQKKDKKAIKIKVAAAIALILVAVVILAVVFLSDKDGGSSQSKPAQPVSTTAADVPLGESDAATTDNTAASPSQPQLRDSSVGFMSGGFDDAASLFYESCYFSAEHSSLVASESVYKGANIRFDCVVLLVDGDTVFVEYGATRGFDGIYNSMADYAAVKAKHTDGISPGDSLIMYGIFTGVESHTVGGKTERLPTFEMQTCTDFVYYGVFSPVFTADDIAAAARRIFGESVTVRESVRSDFTDEAIADILMDGGLFYTAASALGNYCFYAGENSFILDCTSSEQVQKYILPAAASDNIYTYIVDEASGIFTLSRLDKKFNTLWTRDFKNSTDAVFDYTSDYFYIVADSNLYVLDVSTGKNAVSPKYVGSRCGMLKVDDGLLLLSHTGKDAVTKTDLYGNIVWSAELSYNVSSSQGDLPPFLQPLGAGYLVSFESEQGGYYTAFVTHKGKVTYEYTSK